MYTFYYKPFPGWPSLGWKYLTRAVLNCKCHAPGTSGYIIPSKVCGARCRAAKNSDFVRVIGFFNPPLRVRTDIYAINDLFELWTRYKIGINLNYSDTSHFAHAHGTS